MAFQTGVVNQAHGLGGFLQSILIPFLTTDVLPVSSTTTTTSSTTTTSLDTREAGRDWNVVMKQPAKNNLQADTSWGADTMEYVLQNQGHSGNANVLIGFREQRYAVGGIYGIELNVYTGIPSWFAGNQLQTGFTAYNSTYQSWTNMPSIQMIDSTMTYWIYSNRQRVFFALKVSTYYFSAYLGFGIPLGSPNEYPNPLICAGSAPSPTAYTSGGYGMSRPADPNTSIMIVNPANEFLTGQYVVVYPQQHNTIVTDYGPSPDGRHAMWPIYFCYHNDALSADTPQQLYMVSEKVHVTQILNQQSEDIYNDGRYDYRVFQGGDGIDPRNFIGVKEPLSTTTSTSTTTT